MQRHMYEPHSFSSLIIAHCSVADSSLEKDGGGKCDLTCLLLHRGQEAGFFRDPYALLYMEKINAHLFVCCSVVLVTSIYTLISTCPSQLHQHKVDPQLYCPVFFKNFFFIIKSKCLQVDSIPQAW